MFIWVHIKYREIPPIVMSAVLGLVMTFVAYGRHVLWPSAAVGLIGAAAGEGLNGEQDKNSGLKIVGAGAAGALIFGVIGAGIGALIP